MQPTINQTPLIRGAFFGKVYAVVDLAESFRTSGCRCQPLAERLHLTADDRLGELSVVARHVGIRVSENLGQHVDRHAVLDGHAGEGVADAVGGQYLIDAAHGRDLFHVGVHLLVARRGEHP